MRLQLALLFAILEMQNFLFVWTCYVYYLIAAHQM